MNAAPRNITTGVEYTGGNVNRLDAAMAEHDYPTSEWATYRQFSENGRQVQKGQHGVRLQRVVMVTKANGKTDRALKGFTVFNVAQTAEAEAAAA